MDMIDHLNQVLTLEPMKLPIDNAAALLATKEMVVVLLIVVVVIVVFDGKAIVEHVIAEQEGESCRARANQDLNPNQTLEFVLMLLDPVQDLIMEQTLVAPKLLGFFEAKSLQILLIILQSIQRDD